MAAVPSEKLAKTQRGCFRHLHTGLPFTPIPGPNCPQSPGGPTGESLVGEQAQGHLPSQNTSSALPLVPTTTGPGKGLAESQRTGAEESVSPLLGLKFTGSGHLSFLTLQ